MDRRYDSRRRSDDRARDSRRRDERSRSRSRSRSPVTDKYEEERRARMARLRQEMQEEDQELAAIESKAAGEADASKEESTKAKPQEEIIKVNQEELEELDEEEQMKLLLGFTGGFGSTKGQKVADNQTSAARGVAAKSKARKYRQYMNRAGGFNRALDKMD